MQKVRYRLGFNRLNIKFQVLLTSLLWWLFTVRSHYYSLSILNALVLGIDFPIFKRKSALYPLL